ncbi:hypothetical protein MTO96_051360, partial [Rhipicephalus appendiculatus]
SPADITNPDSLDERDSSSSSQGGGGGKAREAPQMTPTPATHERKIVTSTTSGLTGTPTTTKSREPVRFLCTVGPAFTAGMPLPKDGLCTLVFFDSLYAGGGNGLDPTGLPANVMAFLQWAKNSVGQATQFGVSFAIDDKNIEQEIKTKRFESGIDWITAQNIAHFGFLNAYLSYASATHIFKALNVLKGLDDYLTLKNIRTSNTVMALGVAPVYPSEFDTYVELMKQVFMPDLFVAIGHISYSDDGRQDCVILPPSVYAFPQSFTAPYGHTLLESVELLRHVDSIPDHPALVLSLSLHGRIYVPMHPDDGNPDNIGTFTVFNKCNNSDIVAPAEICSSHSPRGLHVNYVYNRIFYVAQSYDKLARKTSTFESEEALIAEVCDIKQTAVPLDFTIAAYDIDRDSAKALCSALTLKGSYARVSVLEKLNHFLAVDYKAAKDRAECFTYAKS